MYNLRCPHCGKDVELIGQKELTEEYGIGPNPVAKRLQEGSMPQPALVFENRRLWLRSDMEEYRERALQERIEKLVADLDRTIDTLPEEERKRARQMFADRAKS